VPIGRWVLEAACREAAELRRRGTPVPVAINLSVRQLEDDALVDDIAAVLVETGLEPRSLVLEVTETSLMRDVEATERRLRALDGLGVRIAIDDFGTGYSSMAYLQRFPVHQLKIDRRFVSDLPGSEQADALIRTLVQLGQNLGLETLAEGVETIEQHRRLVELGCDSAQGFLYSKPVDPTSVPELLSTHGVTPHADPVRPHSS
jgi:EAL domain-containing protein (putative c-di-GMP-specific phosphodiesterase class I)